MRSRCGLCGIGSSDELGPATAARVRAIALAAVFSVVVSVVVEAVDLDPSVGNRRFHVALETADALVLIFLAAVLLGRFRSDGSRRNLLLVGGVVVLAAKNGLFAGLAMFADAVPGDDPLVWGTALSGVVGAGLLAARGTAPRPPDRQLDRPDHGRADARGGGRGRDDAAGRARPRQPALRVSPGARGCRLGGRAPGLQRSPGQDRHRPRHGRLLRHRRRRLRAAGRP